jgi:hypothetical protein
MNDAENAMSRPATDDAPFSALAFKIMTDPFVGSLTFCRVYSGKLESGSYALNSNKNKKERIGRLMIMHANNREDIKTAYAGDIIAIGGLKVRRRARAALGAGAPQWRRLLRRQRPAVPKTHCCLQRVQARPLHAPLLPHPAPLPPPPPRPTPNPPTGRHHRRDAVRREVPHRAGAHGLPRPRDQDRDRAQVQGRPGEDGAGGTWGAPGGGGGGQSVEGRAVGGRSEGSGRGAGPGAAG